MSQNANVQINYAKTHCVGANAYLTPTPNLNGYLAETYFIDGQALTPSSFGQTDATSGAWGPIAYAGTYGNNGFKLNFSDNSAATSTTIGKDSSGNGNNWTPSGISITAGVTNDSLVDTPTNYGSDTGAGGEVRGNYCTLNPLWKGANQTLSNGNLTSVKASGTTISDVWGTFPLTVGKWYFECTVTAVATTAYIGVGQGGGIGEALDDLAVSATSYSYASVDGSKNYGGASVAYGSTFTAGDVIGCAVDMDNGKIWWRKNGTWQASGDPAAGTNAAYTDLLTRGSNAFLPFSSTNGASNSNTLDWNFGQRPYAATAPSGFKALCTQNLPDPAIAKPSDHFDAALYAGSASTVNVTGIGFQPGAGWFKNRSNAQHHKLVDANRGSTKAITPSSGATAESTDSIVTFNSNGFSLATGNRAYSDSNADSFVAWLWNVATVKTSGWSGSPTITPSKELYNSVAGISIIAYTGNATTNATLPHSLGVAPGFIFAKDLSQNTSYSVYHKSLGNSLWPTLNSTSAATSSAQEWGAAPTSSLITIGTGISNSNQAVGNILYAFTDIAGFSKFGSYTGNGSTDGPFIYCGFRPRYVLIKRTDSTGNWGVWDTARDTFNAGKYELVPNASDAETTAAGDRLDFISNGFKLRNVGVAYNASGGTYIFAAFAESPFKTARAR